MCPARNIIDFNNRTLDTDSLALACSDSLPFDDSEPRLDKMKKLFFPIVQPGKLEEFKKRWSEWFVLSDKIEDEKRPGLLKEEFCTQNGEIVCLCAKNYEVICYTKGN